MANTLIVAAMTGDVESVRRLLASGVSPDVISTRGDTPLRRLCSSHSSSGDRVACLKLIINAGANLDASDRRGHTALHRAAYSGQSDLVSLLLQARANLNAADLSNATALHVLVTAAAQGYDNGTINLGRADCAEVLLAAGADMNARNDFGQTPHNMVFQNDNRGSRWLWPVFLRAGAEIPINNTDPYIVRVRNAGGFKKYEQAHLARLTNTFEPKLPMLPKELVRHVVSFWLHAGYY